MELPPSLSPRFLLTLGSAPFASSAACLSYLPPASRYSIFTDVVAFDIHGLVVTNDSAVDDCESSTDLAGEHHHPFDRREQFPLRVPETSVAVDRLPRAVIEAHPGNV